MSDTPDTPEVDLEPFTLAELHERVRGGEQESDLLERLLVATGRGRGVFDLLVGEGLARLQGERVAELGFSFKDYAREVLGMSRRDAENHAHFARELRERPLVREAVLTGRITYRAAQEILPVARGEAEAAWVERASRETVRALRAAVQAERKAGNEAQTTEEEFVRLRVRMRPTEREVVDEALEVADRPRLPRPPPRSRTPRPATWRWRTTTIAGRTCRRSPPCGCLRWTSAR